MNLKSLIQPVLIALIVCIIYDLAIRKMIVKSSYEEDYN